MFYYNSFQIGILACPGGQRFAEEIIIHLNSITTKKYQKKINVLAENYSMSREQVKEQLELFNCFTKAANISFNFSCPDYFIPANFVKFANSEFKTEILTSVRGKDLYIIQDVENRTPLSFHNAREKAILSVNDHIFCMLVTVDAALQAGAKRVTIVLPTYPYSRQHKKRKREGLTAARFGQMMENLGVERIITLDIHSGEIENCFNRLRLENLHASYQIMTILNDLIDLSSPDLVIVSPDTGAVDRNKFYAESLQVPLAMLYKERDYSRLTHNALENNITKLRLLGDVNGKTVFMCDDMLSTGGTLIKAMRFLRDMGAQRIIAAVSLPFFNADSIEIFNQEFKKGTFFRIIGTNAVYHGEAHDSASSTGQTGKLLDREWYISANISRLFALSIYRLHHDKNLSVLLDNRKIIKKLLQKKDTSHHTENK